MILREYEEDGYKIIEYTLDGKTVSSTVRILIPEDIPQPIEPETNTPTLEEMQTQTLINTEYLIAMNEMGIQGGAL